MYVEFDWTDISTAKALVSEPLSSRRHDRPLRRKKRLSSSSQLQQVLGNYSHSQQDKVEEGVLADVHVFRRADGLTWLDSAGRTFTLSWSELRDWVGVRAQSGRIVPKGFPRSNSFGPAF